MLLLVVGAVAAQQETPRPAPQETPEVKKDGMKVQINMMNVCTPSDEEKKGIADALAKIPVKPHFATDFEVARGRSTFPDAPPSTWARIRREFAPDSPLSNVQYSLSMDEKALIETLVFRMRDPKDVLLVTIEDRMSAVTTPASAVAADTPASRIKIERFGKNSLGLSRCEQADQAAYQPVFNSASKLMADYRGLLRVRTTIPGELARAAGAAKPAETAAPAPKHK